MTPDGHMSAQEAAIPIQLGTNRWLDLIRQAARNKDWGEGGGKLMGLTGAFALGLHGLPMLAVREGRVRHQIGRSVRC